MRIGIFGGTFDPPHLGHLILASEAYYQLDLNKVLWVLTPDPPHKQENEISCLKDRMDMVLATIADYENFEISRADIDRPGPHYSVDTVQIIRQEYPQAELIFLMGGDSLHDLPTVWHQADEFVAACDYLGVMRRPGDAIKIRALEKKIPGITQKVIFIDAPLLDIAAHEVRDRVRKGQPYRYYLPVAVYEMIQERGLYLPRT